MNKIELKLKGRVLKCSFGLGFLGELLENLDLSVLEIGEKLDKNPFKWIPTLIFESAKYADKELELTQNELIELLDDSEGKKAMNNFLTAFINSLNKDVPKEEVKNTNPQKKQPKKK